MTKFGRYPDKKFRLVFGMITCMVLAAMLIVPAGVFSLGGSQDNPVIPAAANNGGDPIIETITLQPNATDGKDTYISNDTVLINPSWNFGSDNSLYFGAVNTEPINGLIEFDIPVNIGNLYQATLSAYCRNIVGTPGNFSVYGVSNNWEEGTGGATGPAGIANWSYRLSPLVPWTTPGGDYFTTTNSYINVSQIDVWYSWDVTSIVQNWRSGAWSNYGFFIKSENPPNVGSNYAAFHSSDYTVDTNLTPKLTLSYHAEIDPTIGGQIMSEDDPTLSIGLNGRAHGTIVHQGAPCSSTTGFPWSSADQLRYHALYTPDQVGAEGVIKRISINRASMAVGNYSNYKISLAHTHLTDLTDTFADNFIGNLTEVFSEAEFVANSSNGDTWVHFDLNGNFTYDSQHNLLVDIQYNGRGGSFVSSYVAADVGVKRMWSTTGATTGTTNPFRPAFRFGIDVLDNAVIDEGSNNNIVPFWPTQPQLRAQILFNKTFINQTGIIDKLCFQSGSPGPVSGSYNDFSIRMAHSTNDSLGNVFEANHIGSWVEVYYESVYDISTVGAPEWIEFDLQNTFNYNGNDNLLIEIRWTGSSGDQIPLKTQSLGFTCRVSAWDYSATTATSSDGVFYNFQAIFQESVNLTWSAHSLAPGLIFAEVVGNELRITPLPDQFGVGDVTLTLHNSVGQSVSQNIQVTVNPVNDAPELSGPSAITCTEDIDYVLNMSAYASDIDDDITELTILEDSAYATVDVMEVTFNYPEGIFAETVNITVEDPGGLTDTISLNVTVTPVNDEPVLSSFTDTIICHATVSRPYYITPDDEETPGNLTVYVDSDYAAINGTTITFLYPKGIGSETVTIYLEDEAIYGTQNNVSYILGVTIIDHPDVDSHFPSGTNVTLITTIRVTFDVAMNTTTTEASFTLSTATRADINGKFSWNTGNTTMTFTPETYLTPGLYTASIGTGATNKTGVAILETFAWNFTASGSADGDGDSMPDAYEIAHGLDPTVDDTAGDLDGDGASNLEEYQEGTSPSDPNDKPVSPTPWLLMVLIVLVILAVIVAVVFMLKKKGGKEEERYESQEYQEPAFEQEGPERY